MNVLVSMKVLKNEKEMMDKGDNKEALHTTLRQNQVQYICCQNHKLIADIENDIMDPVMQCTTLPSHSGGKYAIATEY
ncbi:hypothetical protein Tco_0571053 [Tanacetum coccineum]